ncbi:MAG: thrombospondin type 3 repeat-containing protein, partial [Anaerolineales bacterium]
MKKYLPILILILFGLSACTLLFPAQNQLDVSVLEVGYEGDKLAVYLENANADYFITVNGIVYDCEADVDREGVVKCVGPAFEPGKKVTLRVYEDDQASKALGAIDFEVPEPEPDYADADGDGQPDAIDQCPNDPLKATPGICGCGTTEKDDDGDGTPNCIDAYPNDPDRTGDSTSGGGSDSNGDAGSADSDDDGIPDSEDKCPEDPDKSEPGVCGCGVADVDTDEDGVMDCEDQCPEIAYADLIGDPCDKDEDDDGYVDGADQCPYDPLKYFAGACGCGNPDYDTDGDGTADCIDLCPKDANKIEIGHAV